MPVLASLQTESRSRVQSLERLKRQQSGLEKLLRDLRRAIESHPIDSNDASRTCAASSLARERTHHGAVRRIAGRGSQMGRRHGRDRAGRHVRAISDGRSIYADWLPGLGLLAIVDHGEGYLSLYGHNERLYKAVGERVTAGDAIAAAGDSGGRSRPELYFEIRKGGRPVDPRPWFRAAGSLKLNRVRT